MWILFRLLVMATLALAWLGLALGAEALLIASMMALGVLFYVTVINVGLRLFRAFGLTITKT
ncbi:MAG: hypothetical protein ACREPI_05175 [Candidatus Dormibacterales bacterium]